MLEQMCGMANFNTVREDRNTAPEDFKYSNLSYFILSLQRLNKHLLKENVPTYLQEISHLFH